MKTILLLVLCSLSLSSYSQVENLIKSNSSIYDKIVDLSYESIIEDTYFADEGYDRAIAPHEFSFQIIPVCKGNVEIEAIGSGYSAWDDKVIDYDCKLLMDINQSDYKVIKLKCVLENENWPFG